MGVSIDYTTRKQCIKCGKFKKKGEFTKWVYSPDGVYHTCKKCYRISRKTKINKIKTIYSSQITTSIKRTNVLPNYTKQELINWCLDQSLYHKLYTKWEGSNYNKRLAPSCDRIDDYKPYTLDNLQLMTWEENERKGNNDRKSGINNKHSKAIIQYNKEHKLIGNYYSIHEAERKTGISFQNISACCRGKRKSAGGYIWEYI